MREQKYVHFIRQVNGYFSQNGRQLPWRESESNGTFDPYKILVSEVMLQQTQVSRVIPKYREFLEAFPTLTALATSPFSDVLKIWSGLGYNRRARYLHQCAQILAANLDLDFPKSVEELTKLPGIGKNTAAAILVYSFNQPELFIETNVRSVYLHHFFSGKSEISDAQLMPYIKETLDLENPRSWYWALMDYGSYLKSLGSNPSQRSRHYTKQSRFEGSRRQLRGMILRLLLEESATIESISTRITDERLTSVLEDLLKENLIAQVGNIYSLGK